MIPDRIQQLLTMLATVASLMLGASFSMGATITYDEYEAAAQRYGPNGIFNVGNNTLKKSLRYGSGDYWIVAEFTERIIDSNTYLGASLVITLAVYICMAVTSFRDPYSERNTKLLRAWWFWIRFSIFADGVLLVIGVYTAFMAFRELLRVKVPNVLCAGKTVDPTEFSRCLEGSPYGFDYQHIWNYEISMMMCVMTPLIIVFGLLLPSFALLRKTDIYCKMQKKRVAGDAASQMQCGIFGNLELDQKAEEGPVSISMTPQMVGIGETEGDGVAGETDISAEDLIHNKSTSSAGVEPTPETSTAPGVEPTPETSTAPGVGCGTGAGLGCVDLDLMRSELTDIGLEAHADTIAAAELEWSSLRMNARNNGLLVDHYLAQAGIRNIGHRLKIVTRLQA